MKNKPKDEVLEACKIFWIVAIGIAIASLLLGVINQ